MVEGRERLNALGNEPRPLVSAAIRLFPSSPYAPQDAHAFTAFAAGEGHVGDVVFHDFVAVGKESGQVGQAEGVRRAFLAGIEVGIDVPQANTLTLNFQHSTSNAQGQNTSEILRQVPQSCGIPSDDGTQDDRLRHQGRVPTPAPRRRGTNGRRGAMSRPVASNPCCAAGSRRQSGVATMARVGHDVRGTASSAARARLCLRGSRLVYIFGPSPLLSRIRTATTERGPPKLEAAPPPREVTRPTTSLGGSDHIS